MRLITGLALATALFGSIGTAMAAPAVEATLTGIKGEVLVDTGNGFSPVVRPVAKLKVGDRVMVAKGGSAVLSYDPSCSVPLESPSMTTVAVSACLVGTQGEVGSGDGGGGGTPGTGTPGAALGLAVGGQFLVTVAGIVDQLANENAQPFSP